MAKTATTPNTGTVKQPRNWIRSMTEEAARTDVKMPWARGARRAEMIRRRTETSAGQN